MHRPEKEIWLYALLEANGVPAPSILASSPRGHPPAVLMEFVDGQLLGDLSEGVRDFRSAWRSAGAVLRAVHDIEWDGGNSAGRILGSVVEPFPQGSWGAWHLERVERHAAEALAAGPARRARDVFASGAGRLDKAPLAIVHNDCHAWNFVVDPKAGHCLALLVWRARRIARVSPHDRVSRGR